MSAHCGCICCTECSAAVMEALILNFKWKNSSVWLNCTLVVTYSHPLSLIFQQHLHVSAITVQINASHGFLTRLNVTVQKRCFCYKTSVQFSWQSCYSLLICCIPDPLSEYSSLFKHCQHAQPGVYHVSTLLVLAAADISYSIWLVCWHVPVWL